MILAIDAGNTRIKWGLYQNNAWLKQSWVTHNDIYTLGEEFKSFGDDIRQVVISNVAGPQVETLLKNSLKDVAAAPLWVKANAEQLGVVNNYHRPAQLGSDRWAALIAAKALFDGPCVILNAGTAVTIDALTEAGVFTGGVILPGINMMRHALAQNTQLSDGESGQFESFPRSTENALTSGPLIALAGAATFTAKNLEKLEQQPCKIILSGGDARQLSALLEQPHTILDNLVLEGLIRMVTP